MLRAVRAQGAIEVDGRLDEPDWLKAPAAIGFVQRDPEQGRSASEETELRLVFDDHALYAGVRLRDSAPDAISRQLSRRDAAFEADAFALLLDPHHDHRTGVLLEVSAAGVQRDAALYDDNFEDVSWDAVWESAVTRDASGWTLEMRVPLAQLRFTSAAAGTWGINARRVIHRKNESAWLALVPKNESGLVSRMAHLEGLAAVRPSRHLELLPYASARAEYVEPPAGGSPWNDGSRHAAGAGLDLEYGLGSGLTLVGAFNPDFGQVEVDPAVVNLTAFETFFEEKRPFFTEGSQVFLRFGRSGSSDYTSFFYPEPLLFYSRRIGRAPQGVASGTFLDVPATTTILGAAKLVGRAHGWNVGVLEAVTGREYARVETDGSRSELEVEPLTSYFVGRAQRELGSRGALGLLTTATLRDLRTPGLEAQIPGRAFLGGVDGHIFLDSRRDWVLFGGLSGSSVSGSRAAVLRLQRASQRYYQRPDAPHVAVDPQATSLSGWSGRLGLNKNSGNVTWNAGLWGISPGYEPNDLGFATQTDRGGAHAQVLFRKLTPDRYTRSRQLAVSKWWTFNYGRESQGDGVQLAASALFRSFWKLDLTLGKSWNTLDDKLTRGGPTTIRPGIETLGLGLSTDVRRRFWATTSFVAIEREFGSRSRQVLATLNLRPFTALTLQATPYWLKNDTAAQYLQTVLDPTAAVTYGSRYVFGRLQQREISIPLRLNLALSPKLSFQLYTQALVSAGDYPEIKELAAPRSYDFPVYGRDTGTIALDPERPLYTIDPDGGGEAPSFRLAVPDFNLKSLRLNAVLRYEFRPGSAAYVVWTDRRQDGRNPGDGAFGRDLGDLFAAPADDVLLLKIAWWFGR
ncbi:MAG TPA: DUF5916 domain-containing protein [Vicinamibacteria bacterium]